MNKICLKCKKNKAITKFSKCKSRKDGLSCYCKKCVKKYQEENKEKIKKQSEKYRQKNKDKIQSRKKKYRQENKDKIRKYEKEYREKYREKRNIYNKKYDREHKEEKKRWYQEHKEEIKKKCQKNRERKLEYVKKYYQKNKERIKNYKKEYCQRNKEKINECQRNKRKNDINFRILNNLRSRLYHAFKFQNIKKLKHTMNLIGCSIDFLKKQIEYQFLIGMNWNNYGLGNDKWCVDHAKPCVAFDLTKESEQRKCFNYKNLQPLWNKDNWSKGSYYNGKYIRTNK